MSIPYSRQWIEDEDVEAVSRVLRSTHLTTGPLVDEFEDAVARYVGTTHAVAVSSGTAALHTTMACLGLGPGDEVIVPCMTFAATANAVVHCGAIPVFADIDPNTLLAEPGRIEPLITQRTAAIVAVDYAGQPCDYSRLRALARRYNAFLLADACHSLGGADRGQKVGSLADASIFSFHPVKPITSGEGGMVSTNDSELADRMRRFRNHGIDRDSRARMEANTWEYQMVSLGLNYRLSDIHCALGLSQLKKCDSRRDRRQAIAARYREAFGAMSGVTCLSIREGVTHAWHLFVVRIDFAGLGRERSDFFAKLREDGIGVNVHYLPVHLHRYYREHWSTKPGLCPDAEAAFEEILSLPLHAAMSEADVNQVIDAVRESLGN